MCLLKGMSGMCPVPGRGVQRHVSLQMLLWPPHPPCPAPPDPWALIPPGPRPARACWPVLCSAALSRTHEGRVWQPRPLDPWPWFLPL